MISKGVAARAHTRTFAIGVDYITEHTHQRAMAKAGHSFESGVSYASAPEKAEWVHLRGVISVETAAIEMEAVAALSRRCRDPVYHLIVAYAKNEHPTREQVVSDAERLFKAIGMEKSQYVLAVHKDTDDYHAHVIANRIGPDGKANDLWQERIKRERVCAEIAAERGWQIVVGHHNRDIVQRVRHLYAPPPDPERGLSDGAYRRLHERGELPWQESARPYVLDAVDRATGWTDLHQRLAAHGVMAKLVRRGERVRGLAFAEGHQRGAPGCAASRIDPCCALPALERRFGPFTLSREMAKETIDATRWVQSTRPTILAAVDNAKSWDELTQRLDRDGIVVKLVQRGARVQGLSFAQGRDSDAPGCGASRVHPRCKKAALEQRFGACSFQPEQRHARSRSAVRDHAERGAQSDPRWALRDAQRIVDHARIRSEYAAYRNRFFGDRERAISAQREAAWERERAKRQRDARRRREARLLLRAAARLGMRGVVARQLAYWSIDTIMNRRRARDFDSARVRWEASKIVLSSERQLTREERPMSYRSFVAERAQKGDLGAQRVLDALVKPTHSLHRAPEPEPRRMRLAEVRLDLNRLRAEEHARFERIRVQRKGLDDVAKPPTLDSALADERRRIQQQVTKLTEFTDPERARLAQLAKEKQSWNPLTRRTAIRDEERVRGIQRLRYENALAERLRSFEQHDVPRIEKDLAAHELRYHRYAEASIGLERQMIQTRANRDDIPKLERRIEILERAGISHLEVADVRGLQRFDRFMRAIDQHYRALPETVRSQAERSIDRERRARESMTMDR